MFGLFQCCILPDGEGQKQGALDGCSSPLLVDDSSAVVKQLGASTAPSLPSFESTDDDIFQDETEGDENQVPEAQTYPQDQQQQKVDPIQDFQKHSKESFRVVETDKNHILMSRTQVVVFRKPTTEMEAPKLLHIHQRANNTAMDTTTKKKKQSRRDHNTTKQQQNSAVLSSRQRN